MSEPGIPERQLIADVDACDLDRARAFVTQAIGACADSWIPPWLIADALALELSAFVHQHTSPPAMVGYLRQLASAIESSSHAGSPH